MAKAEPASLATATTAPRSLAELFWSFTWIALQGFGGVLTIAQREMVDKRRWFTREQFLEDWSVAQVLPGPNIVNLSLMFGGRHFGWRGALVAVAGMLTIPLLGLLVLAVLFASVAETAVAQGILRGMGAVAAGLIIAAGLKLAAALRGSVMGHAACALVAALAFVAVALLRVPLVWVLLGLGGLSSAWAWVRLGRR